MQWLAALCSDAAYFCGDLPKSVEYAKEALLAPFLSAWPSDWRTQRPEGKCVQLPVPFVRQHYHTCVPATAVRTGRQG